MPCIKTPYTPLILSREGQAVATENPDLDLPARLHLQNTEHLSLREETALLSCQVALHRLLFFTSLRVKFC